MGRAIENVLFMVSDGSNGSDAIFRYELLAFPSCISFFAGNLREKKAVVHFQ